MKSMLLALPLLLASTLAQANDRGDRIEHRWDRRGDHIDLRLDRAAARQEALGHDRAAEHLDLRGDHIDRRMDRVGARREARFDRRHP